MIFSGALSKLPRIYGDERAGACSNLLQTLAIMRPRGVRLVPAAWRSRSRAISGEGRHAKRDGIDLIRVALRRVERPMIRKNAIRFFRIKRQKSGTADVGIGGPREDY
jgi:hypothetical protein